MYFQQYVRSLSLRFLSELGRHAYVTPTSYLELIATFKRLLALKSSEVILEQTGGHFWVKKGLILGQGEFHGFVAFLLLLQLVQVLGLKSKYETGLSKLSECATVVSVMQASPPTPSPAFHIPSPCNKGNSNLFIVREHIHWESDMHFAFFLAGDLVEINFGFRCGTLIVARWDCRGN